MKTEDIFALEEGLSGSASQLEDYYIQKADEDAHGTRTAPTGGRRVDPKAMRISPTGATRDHALKPEHFKFFSPRSFHAYTEYMFGKRIQPDGALRDANNWANGMPRDWYVQSGGRHWMDVVYHLSDCSELATEDLETALCAMMFNVQALLHEVLVDRDVQENEE